MKGLVVAVAAMATAPAMACGFGACAAPGYYAAPVYSAPIVNYGYVYSGCNTGCGGWAVERLPDPVQQYYYINQGPTYTGPGNWAPRPVYEGTYPRYGYATRRAYARGYYHGHRVLRRYY
nr:hypothetical protein [Bradyrhizobium lablabi]